MQRAHTGEVFRKGPVQEAGSRQNRKQIPNEKPREAAASPGFFVRADGPLCWRIQLRK